MFCVTFSCVILNDQNSIIRKRELGISYLDLFLFLFLFLVLLPFFSVFRSNQYSLRLNFIFLNFIWLLQRTTKTRMVMAIMTFACSSHFYSNYANCKSKFCKFSIQSARARALTFTHIQCIKWHWHWNTKWKFTVHNSTVNCAT